MEISNSGCNLKLRILLLVIRNKMMGKQKSKTKWTTMCHHSLHSLSGFQRGREKDCVFKVQMFVLFQYQITATSVTEISSVYLRNHDD
jgi:hypothetical protein